MTRRTIVVGAGAIGCCAAWHLRQRDDSVLVIDAASGPASQATAAAAGFVAHWSSVHIGAWGTAPWQMQDYGIDFYTRLASDRTDDIGFGACGIAYVYTTPDAWRAVQPLIDGARALGTPLEVLAKPRARELVPEIDAERTAGIVFDPGAIRLRAADAVPALAAELEEMGVEFRFGARVTGFATSGGQVEAVETADGERIEADRVVVAAGAWTRPLVESAGGKCPADPKTETRYTTKPLAGVRPDLPMFIFSDCLGFYIREERGGLLIGGSDEGQLPAHRLVDVNDPPSREDIVPDQAYRVRENLRRIENVMPVLKNAEIDRIDSGIPTFTQDVGFLVDMVPGAENLHFVAGCNEGGVTHGPGLGRLVADLAHGQPSDWDVFRVERT